MKKFIAMLLTIVLTAVVAVGGTLAYLTDRDSEANVFTVGDVNIDLNEDFVPGATLIPGVSIGKEPTITNVGPNKAYVWATVAVPEKLASVIKFGNKGDGWEDWGNGSNTVINNENYVLYTILHTDALEVDDETNALFTTVALDNTVDIDPDGNWHTVVDGAATDLGWKNSDGNPVIHVSAYAIQTDGFDSVEAAYVAYNTQWGDKGTAYSESSTLVGTADELAAAIAEGKSVVLTADISVDGTNMVTVPKQTNVAVNLNGHDITADFSAKTDGASAIFTIDKDATLTVNGEGHVSAVAAPTMNYVSSIFTNLGTLVVNDGQYSMTYGSYAEGYLIPTIIDTNSNIGKATTTINGGTFKHTRNMFRNFAQPNRGENNATLIINGGNFNGEATDYATIWNQKTSSNGVEGDGIVIINGGTFNYVDIENDFDSGVTIANGLNITEKQ